jgi:nucleoside 2-deoxyribosyltransferase
MQNKRVLIIGEVFVDQHLDVKVDSITTSRLGGIFHAIRGCNALGVEFAFAYYSPDYLAEDIVTFGEKILGAQKICRIGSINNAPNVMLIGRSDEFSNQLYDNILCKQATYKSTDQLEPILNDFCPTDILIFTGRYGNERILNELSEYNGRIHIDISYDSDDILGCISSIQTILLSTSSPSFKTYFEKSSYNELIDLFLNKKINQLIIKENRGGSWLYDYTEKNVFEAPAYVSNNIYSVGVGDVYDIAYILDLADTSSQNMILASWIASLYGQTLDHEVFKSNVQDFIPYLYDFIELEGIRVPWNGRKQYPIYLAAPDFENVNTKIIDTLEYSLLYHNFNPRRPVKENGQVQADTGMDEEMRIFAKDMMLLSECKLMIATLLYNDQGTLVEIGFFLGRKKPIILYDPYHKLNNMFLKNSCDYYCVTNSQVINAVFTEVYRMMKDEI